MAGHLLLLREDEPDTFEVLERLGHSIVENCVSLLEDIDVYGLKVCRLPETFVFNKQTTQAFKVGPFSPNTTGSGEPVTLEVHYDCTGDEIKLKYVFYVA